MSEHWYSSLPNRKKNRPYKGFKTCPECGNTYFTHVVVQTFRRDIDYDMCPYCGVCNGISKELMYINRRIE